MKKNICLLLFIVAIYNKNYCAEVNAGAGASQAPTTEVNNNNSTVMYKLNDIKSLLKFVNGKLKEILDLRDKGTMVSQGKAIVDSVNALEIELNNAGKPTNWKIGEYAPIFWQIRYINIIFKDQ